LFELIFFHFLFRGGFRELFWLSILFGIIVLVSVTTGLFFLGCVYSFFSLYMFFLQFHHSIVFHIEIYVFFVFFFSSLLTYRCVFLTYLLFLIAF